MRTVGALASMNAASGALLGAVLVLVPQMTRTGAEGSTTGTALATAAYAVASSMALGLGTLSGRWADGHGLRPLVGASGVVLVLSAAACLSRPDLAAAALAVGTGTAAGLTYVPSLALVAGRPSAVRSRQLAVLVTGNAVGGLLGPLLVSRLLAGPVPALGTEVTQPSEAAAAVLVMAGLVHGSVTRAALPTARSAVGTTAEPSWQVGQPGPLRRLSLGAAAAAAGVSGLMALLVPVALAEGAAPSTVALLPATAAGSALAGRLGQLGWGTRVAASTVLRACGVVVAGCALALTTVTGDVRAMLGVIAVAGVAQGAWVAALPQGAVEVAACGHPSGADVGPGRTLGTVYAHVAAGTLLGTTLLGVAVEAWGARTGFGACAVLCLVSAAAAPLGGRYSADGSASSPSSRAREAAARR